ncbi:MAG: hypothetical protein SPJ63_01585 [Oscillospiraceae bacterium]|nr:hypothetical protein [Oscillospiraceae bacterium]
MFEILREWFGMGISLPVVATDLFFAAIGLYAALKISNKKTVIYIMLITIVVYIIASLVAESSIVMFAVYAVFVGALAFFTLIGAAVGLLVRWIKK